jgi:cytidine deaminase
MKKTEIISTFTEYQYTELNAADQELLDLAKDALDSSYSPYSRFRVGAAIRLESGRLLSASNQENIAYPSGLCAERVLLFGYGAQVKNDPIRDMAVIARADDGSYKDFIKPCGACLQVMAEYQQLQTGKYRVLLSSIDGRVIECDGVDQLLPLQFKL